MRFIKLTQGKYAMVDDCDFEWLNSFKWHAFRGPHTWYAAKKCVKKGKRGILFMHQLLCPARELVDHRDGNGQHNSRSNLRPATQGLNKGNSKKWMKATSRFKGVCWNKSHRAWIVRIGTPPHRHVLGYFNTDIEAAKTYDIAARTYYGEFARTNFT